MRHCLITVFSTTLLSLSALCHAGFAAVESSDGKVFTQTPELAPVAGREANAASPTEATSPTLWKDGPVPSWIWGAEQDGKYLLTTTFPGGVRSVRIIATCDNVMTLKVNGNNVGSSSEWQEPVDVDVTKQIVDGQNTITAEVANAGGASGFICKIAITRANGKVDYLVSGQDWKAASVKTPNDVSAPKVLAKLGASPWGDVFSGDRSNRGDREVFHLLPGFQVERLFSVPKDTLGSWVCIAADDKGRLIVSDQGDKGLCRITPPAIGGKEATKVERLDVKMSSAQGMLFAFGSLYVSVNGGQGSGLYRLRDTNGDDQFDEVVKLKDIRGGGEHGPHALRLSPDGKSIYLICGNHTQPPFELHRNSSPQTMGGTRPEQLRAELPAGMSSRIAPNWDEDLAQGRQWDGNGHAAGILAPGGWIAKTDPDGKSWELISMGYRNPYDMAFNADGELFAYDADMEWDIGSPWYRPTRVVHATSGSEFGWRSGTGKWPTYYVDSLPQLVDVGPGSPVGVEFGYGTKFPAKYQKALYILDWTFGTMYAIHIEPDGASYRATKEEFVARTPLPLTDATVGRDGALYFTVGGRGTQSELFRVTYVGTESVAPADARNVKFADLRELRHKIEAHHQPTTDGVAIPFLVGQLSHADRHIRYAARVALERHPTSSWQAAVLNSNDVETVITGAVGLARQGDSASRPEILRALGKIDFGKLSTSQKLEYLRAYELTLVRQGPIDDPTRLQLATKFETLFPTNSPFENRELVNLMVLLQAPNAAKKVVPILAQERKASLEDIGEVLNRNKGYGAAIAAMLANQPDQEQMHYAFALRILKSGWSVEDRKTYFQWFQKARAWSGGASYQNFLKNIDNEAFANASDAERLAVEALGARKPYIAPELPKPIGPGRDYSLANLQDLAGTKNKGRDFKNGQRAFAAARCVVCHRFAGDGGATGPDLTQLAGRFNVKDLSEAIVDPSKVISDQYKASIVHTIDGRSHTGRIVSETNDSVTIVIDPENATKTEVLKKDQIDEVKPSPVSLMPKDLLKQLNEDEVADLMAYLLSRGNPQDAMFRK